MHIPSISVLPTEQMPLGAIDTIGSVLESALLSPFYIPRKITNIFFKTLLNMEINVKESASAALSLVPVIGPMLSNHYENTGGIEGFHNNSPLQQFIGDAIFSIPDMIFNAHERLGKDVFPKEFKIALDSLTKAKRKIVDSYLKDPSTRKYLSLAKDKKLRLAIRQFVRMKSEDGRFLDGKLVRPKGNSFKSPTIVLYHGNGTGIECFTQKECSMYLKMGYNVFMPTYAGDAVYGDGLSTNCSEKKLNFDLKAHLKFLLELGVKCFSVYGHSLGGSLALTFAQLIGKEAEVSAIILDRTFTSASEVTGRAVSNFSLLPVLPTIVESICRKQFAIDQHRSGFGDGLNNLQKLLNLHKFISVDKTQLFIVGGGLDVLMSGRNYLCSYDSKKNMSFQLQEAASKGGFRNIHHIFDHEGLHASPILEMEDVSLIKENGDETKIPSYQAYLEETIAVKKLILK